MIESQSCDIGKRIGYNAPDRQFLAFIEQSNCLISSQLLQRRYGVYKKPAKHELSFNLSDNDVSVLRGDRAIDGQN